MRSTRPPATTHQQSQLPNDPLRHAIETTDLPGLVARYYPDSGARGGVQGVVHAVWRGDEHASFSLFVGRDNIWLYRDHATGENGNAYTFLTDIAGFSSSEAATILTAGQTPSVFPASSRRKHLGSPGTPKGLSPQEAALWRALQQERVRPFVHPRSRCLLSLTSSVSCLQEALGNPQARGNARIIRAAYAALKRSGTKRRKAGKHGAFLEAYDYTDEAGKLLYQVVRFEPKSFAQRRKDPHGEGWVWGLNAGGYTRTASGDWVPTDAAEPDRVLPETRRVLYRLPRLLEGIQGGRGVLIPEGERDVHALEALGFIATTNPGGALKWHDADGRNDYGAALRGARVYLLPDNDDAGREHVQHVQGALTGIAVEVHVVELPDLPPKGDVTDWLNMGHDRKELIAQLLRAHKA